MHTEEELKIPINTYYTEIVQGQSTIRAYGKVPEKKEQFSSRLATYNGAKLIVSGIDSLITFFIYNFSTLYLTIVMVYFFFVDNFTYYDAFLLINVFLMEAYLIWINETIITFYIQVKCVTKCEELAKIPPEEGYRPMLSEWTEDDEERVFEKAAVARTMSPFTRGEIEFRGVSLCYRPELGDVLRGVSFKVRAGEKVGVVGRTGSGKSTLFLALLRIIVPRAGVILVDGVDCARVGLASLRASVNFILQEHFLFSGTVRAVLPP
jgi:ABC-type multidrug transport system fused ATPase/permease subunit